MAELEAMLQQQQFDVALEELARGVDRKTAENSDDLDEADIPVSRSQSQWLPVHHRGRRTSVATYTSQTVYPLHQAKASTPSCPVSPTLTHRKVSVRQGHSSGSVSAVQTWLAHQARHSAQDLNSNSEIRSHSWQTGHDRHTACKPHRSQAGKPMRRRWPTISKIPLRDQVSASLSSLNNMLPMFSPFSSGRRCWELAIMLIVLYNAVSVPLDISYGMPDNHNIANYLEYALDLVFAMDIMASFRTAYVDATGHLVRDAGPIAANYLKVWFWIDLFATIPYDLLVEALFKGQINKSQVLMLKILRTPRLLRLGRLMRILDRFKAANMIRVFMVVCAMSLISHWLACIWYMLYKFTSYGDYTDWGIFLSGDIPADATLSAYLSAYYQSFLMMVGNNQEPFNNIERIFMIMVMIIGACFYSAMVGQMAVLVANLNAMALRHRQKQDSTLDVLRYLGLPNTTLARVQAYFTYITAVSHPAAEGMAFLTELPKALQDQVTTWLYRSHLEQVPLFNGLNPAFLSSLALRMRIVTFTPKETIFRAGDLGHDMYIIRKGCVAVVGKNNEIMNVLCAGAHFGDLAMFTMSKRTAKCVALSNCDLAVLNTYDLKIVMKDFPQASETLQMRTEEELRNLQVAGRAGLAQEDLDDADWLLDSSADQAASALQQNVAMPQTGQAKRIENTSTAYLQSEQPDVNSRQGVRFDSAQHVTLNISNTQQTASTPASNIPSLRVSRPTAEGVHQADIQIGIHSHLCTPSAWQGNYTPRIGKAVSIMDNRRHCGGFVSHGYTRNRYAGSQTRMPSAVGEAKDISDISGAVQQSAQVHGRQPGLPAGPLVKPSDKTAAAVRASLSGPKPGNSDAKTGLQDVQNSVRNAVSRGNVRSSIDLLFEAAGFTVPVNIDEHADLLSPSLSLANLHSSTTAGTRLPVISGPCCVWRNAIATSEENNDTPFCLWVRAGASHKGGRVYHATVAHTKELRRSLEHSDASSWRGSTKGRSEKEIEHGLLRFTSQQSRSSITRNTTGVTVRQIRGSQELLSPALKQLQNNHPLQAVGKLTPRSSAAEALSRSQEEVRQLQVKLNNLQRAGAEERKLLFRQTLSALQLVEGLMDRVGQLEDWVHNVELEITRIVALKQQSGTHQNILGVHLEEPGLSNRPSTSALAHVMSIQMRPMSVSSPNLQNDFSPTLKPSMKQPSVRRQPGKQASRLMIGQTLQDAGLI